MTHQESLPVERVNDTDPAPQLGVRWPSMSVRNFTAPPPSPNGSLKRRLTIQQGASVYNLFQEFGDGDNGVNLEQFLKIKETVLDDPVLRSNLSEMEKVKESFLNGEAFLETKSKITYQEFQGLYDGKAETKMAIIAFETMTMKNIRVASEARKQARKQQESNHVSNVTSYQVRRMSAEVHQAQKENEARVISDSTMKKKLSLKGLNGPWSRKEPIRKIWDVSIMLIVCLQVIYIPFMIAFQPDTDLAWNSFELCVDFIFILDMMITFNTIPESDQEDGPTFEPIVKRSEIAMVYFRGWFLLDFVASVPFDRIIILFVGTQDESRGAAAMGLARILRIPRFFRILRMMRLFRLLQGNLKRKITYYFYYSEYSNIIQLIRFLLMIILICHYMACALYAVCAPLVWFRLEDCNGEPCDEASTYMKYVTSFYTIFLLMNGEDIEPRTDEEKAFSVVVILLGSLLVATIFGNVAVIVTNFSAEQSRYRNKMTSLYEQMIHLRLQQDLKSRIILYYGEMWKNYRSLDGKIENFIGELNGSLESEILLCWHNKNINNIEIFQSCSKEVILNLMKHLKIEVFQYGDYISKVGDQGKEMFLIGKGKCEKTENCPNQVSVPATETKERRLSQLSTQLFSDLFSRSTKVSPSPEENEEIGDSYEGQQKSKRFSIWDKEETFAQLSKGSIFGEIALVYNTTRGYNVRATHSLCEIHILTRSIFDMCFAEYPDEKQIVKSRIVKKYDTDQVKEPCSDIIYEIIEKKKPEECISEISARLSLLEEKLIRVITQMKSKDTVHEFRLEKDNNENI